LSNTPWSPGCQNGCLSEEENEWSITTSTFYDDFGFSQIDQVNSGYGQDSFDSC
jgi:hypothetical protein